MSHRHWSFLLSWARVGINAALFLAATRVLTLAEIGLFATAFAPIKLVQSVQKAGLSDAVVMFGPKGARWSALALVSVVFGGLMTLVFATLGTLVSPTLFALSIVPLVNGIGATSDGILRHRMAIKALALRTVFAQSIAAVLALVLLWQGLGVWALVVFSVVSAALTSILSILLAGWVPRVWPRWKQVQLILPKTAQIAGRVLINASLIPIAQLAVGLALGPVAAGAFQIATRMFELIDALTLSPLRYIALPRLARSTNLASSLRTQFQETAYLSVWIWCGVASATVPILSLAVGPAHAEASAPILQALVPLGLTSALMMPVTQAVTAKGHTGLILRRSILVLVTGFGALAFSLSLSAAACAWAVTITGIAGHIWLLRRALPQLTLPLTSFAPVLPALGAGSVMMGVLWIAPAMPLWGQITIGTITYVVSLVLAHTPQRRFA